MSQSPNRSNPNPSNPSQQTRNTPVSGQSGGGQINNPGTSQIGNNVEKDEPVAQGGGGMKTQG